MPKAGLSERKDMPEINIDLHEEGADVVMGERNYDASTIESFIKELQHAVAVAKFANGKTDQGN